jgi:Fe2+ or Zn2+ uptake regulation protein
MSRIYIVQDKLHICLLGTKKTYCGKTKSSSEEIEEELLEETNKMAEFKIRVEHDLELDLCEECMRKNKNLKNLLQYSAKISFLLLVFLTFLFLVN